MSAVIIIGIVATIAGVAFDTWKLEPMREQRRTDERNRWIRYVSNLEENE